MRIAKAPPRRLNIGLLQTHGAAPDAARPQPELLIKAGLRGLPSHGPMRWPSCLQQSGLPVAMPGDGARRRRTAALRDGIKIPDALMNEFRSLHCAV